MTRSSRTEILVRLAGIEPTTPWFVAKYSIQLSYSREALHYVVLIRDRSTISERTRRSMKPSRGRGGVWPRRGQTPFQFGGQRRRARGAATPTRQSITAA